VLLYRKMVAGGLKDIVLSPWEVRGGVLRPHGYLPCKMWQRSHASTSNDVGKEQYALCNTCSQPHCIDMDMSALVH